MNRTMLGAIFGAALLATLVSASLAESSKSDTSERSEKSELESLVELPKPPERIGNAADLSQTCLDCHDEIAELQSGDKHIANDFQCVVCHGISKAHVEQEVEGTMPDRAWRRWIEDFEKGTHGDMDSASTEKRSSCIKCHPPH